MKELFERLRAAFANLALREKLLVGGAGGLILLFVVWFALVSPVLGALFRASERAATAEREIKALAALRAEFDEVQGRLSTVETRIQANPSGNLFTTLESLARQATVRVDSMEPQTAPTNDRYRETKVQVVLKGVSLAQTVAYLQRIDSAPQPLSIKSLRLRTRPENPELLDVTFTVSSFEPVS